MKKRGELTEAWAEKRESGDVLYEIRILYYEISGQSRRPLGYQYRSGIADIKKLKTEFVEFGL